MLVFFAALAALTVSAEAQVPARSPAPAPFAIAMDGPSPTATDTGSQAKPGGGTANEWTYKTKDGQMYQPPAQRPTSPAMDTKIYGRT